MKTAQCVLFTLFAVSIGSAVASSNTQNKSFSGANFVDSTITVAQLNAMSTLEGTDLSGLNLVGLASRPSSRGGNFTGSNLAGATLSPSFLKEPPGCKA